MTDDWFPLSFREGMRDSGYDALAEDVPSYMEDSLWHWVEETVERLEEAGEDLVAMARWAERVLRRKVGYGLGFSEARVKSDSETFLDVIDFLVAYIERYDWKKDSYAELNELLRQAGSLWTVSTDLDPPTLTRVIDRASTEVAAAVLAIDDRPSQHLRKAWSDVYGRNPDASDGYREAVRAIEAAAQPVVSPEDKMATLGKMITAMRAKPAKWEVVLNHPDADTQVLHVADMLDLVWKGQHDRHGKADPNAPLDVDLAEAEAALHAATTLVHWFRSGAVAPRAGND